MASSNSQTDDPFDLARFVSAQRSTYEVALRELKAGQKRSHWIWFIFPQIDGLGSSSMAKQHGIKSMDEARSYIKHPLLGTRLLECTKTVLQVKGRTALEIFGIPDNLKFRSSITLFELVA